MANLIVAYDATNVSAGTKAALEKAAAAFGPSIAPLPGVIVIAQASGGVLDVRNALMTECPEHPELLVFLANDRAHGA